MVHRIVVTGGAGFVGSTLALGLKARHPAWEVVSLDNLKRRGSELSLVRLAEGGVTFVHGDVRSPEDLEPMPAPSVILDCAAEPSVLAGMSGSTAYVVDTNLRGTIHCLELARRSGAALVFLSTSRVYPVAPLEALPYVETETRFELGPPTGDATGWSREGIAEGFTLEGARSIYGTTKLSSELLIGEYVEAFGLRAVIDRCGLIAGPWQMGKVDQGVVTHWIASHEFGRPLRYVGYGGRGKQVRDVLHADDLVELVDLQLREIESLRGEVFNVGGGRAGSTSLLELTRACERATSRTVPMGSEPETRKADVRIYLSDCRKVKERFGWAPTKTVEDVVGDTARWMRDHREVLGRTLGG